MVKCFSFSLRKWLQGMDWSGPLSLTPPDNTWLLTDLKFSTSRACCCEFCLSAKGDMVSVGTRQWSGLSHCSCRVGLVARDGSVWSPCC